MRNGQEQRFIQLSIIDLCWKKIGHLMLLSFLFSNFFRFCCCCSLPDTADSHFFVTHFFFRKISAAPSCECINLVSKNSQELTGAPAFRRLSHFEASAATWTCFFSKHQEEWLTQCQAVLAFACTFRRTNVASRRALVASNWSSVYATKGWVR
jgi:hypothetical protein